MSRVKIRRPSGQWTIPILTMSAGDERPRLSPRSRTWPLAARISAEMTRSVVDLPAPLAPIKATICPSPTSKEIPLSAVIWP